MKKNTSIIILLCLMYSFPVRGFESKAIDIMVVIDNSASMKKNDPDYLLKQALTVLIRNLQPNTNTGFILFSDQVDMFFPLRPMGSGTAKTSLNMVFKNINYNGKFTNIPLAIERAYYELIRNGRKESDKCVVFMTDGIVDLPDKGESKEKSEWLKTVLVGDCNKDKVAIFSIAFTEKADFELIQTLASKTGGSYYRAMNVSEMGKVFNEITQLLKTRAEQGQSQPSADDSAVEVKSKQPTVESSGTSTSLIIILIVIAVVVVIAVVFLLMKKGQKGSSKVAEGELPEAYLIDVTGITNKGTIQLRKKVTRIGRVEANDVYIPDEKNYISSFHAMIEYSDSRYYLIDQESVNGTYLNGERLEGKKKVLLKGGDEISFDKFNFKFLCPQEGERGQTVMHNNSLIANTTIQHLPEEIIENGSSVQEDAIEERVNETGPENSEKTAMGDDNMDATDDSNDSSAEDKPNPNV